MLTRTPSGVSAGSATTLSSWNSSRCRRLIWTLASSSSTGVGSTVIAPAWPSMQHQRALGNLGQRAGHAHHGGNAQRMRQDRRVRRASAFLADQAHHMLAVELHREPGRQLVRHHDHLLVVRQRPDLLAGAPQQHVEHAQLDGVQVGEPVAQVRALRRRPQRAQLERLELVRGLGRQQVVADEHFDATRGIPRPAPSASARRRSATPPRRPAPAPSARVPRRCPTTVVTASRRRCDLALDLVRPHGAVGHLGKVGSHEDASARTPRPATRRCRGAAGACSCFAEPVAR